MTFVAWRAIDESVRSVSTVTIPWTAVAALDLAEECDGTGPAGADLIAFWGADDKGNTWRVHLDKSALVKTHTADNLTDEEIQTAAERGHIELSLAVDTGARLNAGQWHAPQPRRASARAKVAEILNARNAKHETLFGFSPTLLEVLHHVRSHWDDAEERSVLIGRLALIILGEPVLMRSAISAAWGADLGDQIAKVCADHTAEIERLDQEQRLDDDLEARADRVRQVYRAATGPARAGRIYRAATGRPVRLKINTLTVSKNELLPAMQKSAPPDWIKASNPDGLPSISDLRRLQGAMARGPFRFDYQGWIENMDRSANHTGAETEVFTLGARNDRADGKATAALLNAAPALLEIAAAALAFVATQGDQLTDLKLALSKICP